MKTMTRLEVASALQFEAQRHLAMASISLTAEQAEEMQRRAEIFSAGAQMLKEASHGLPDRA